VVVFSHGLGSSRYGYGYLGRALAARGYVSVHPTHREPKGDAAVADPEVWRARPRAVSSVIDALPELGLQLDLDRLGVAGHSYGAFTALACAGARLRIGLEPGEPGELVDLSEPRARAFVALSPPGNGTRGLGPWSWATVTRPVLCITGTRDQGPQDRPYTWRLESHEAIAAAGKELLVLEGAEHETFAGGLPGRRADPEQLAAIEHATLDFFDRHLSPKVGR
jgi:predicted dienelactone hydrolase